MKKFISILMILAITVSSFAFLSLTSFAATPQVLYRSHVQDIGWMNWVSNGATSGTEGRCLRMEAFQVKLSGVSGNISYRAHVQDIGWMNLSSNGATAGTTGRSLRAEAVQVVLSGAAANSYDVMYRVHVQDIGWMSWVSNGQVAGTTGRCLRVEAIQIKLVTKGSVPPTPTDYFGAPMRDYWVTQAFNRYSSSRASRGQTTNHAGIDIKANNTDVFAAATGTVLYRNYTNGNGNHVIIKHNLNGATVYTLYSHLANFNGCPSVNATVQKGQKIGVMGNTGNSSGPHLHFAVFTGTYSSDPNGYTFQNSSTKMSYGQQTYYSPEYVIQYDRLP